MDASPPRRRRWAHHLHCLRINAHGGRRVNADGLAKALLTQCLGNLIQLLTRISIRGLNFDSLCEILLGLLELAESQVRCPTAEVPLHTYTHKHTPIKTCIAPQKKRIWRRRQAANTQPLLPRGGTPSLPTTFGCAGHGDSRGIEAQRRVHITRREEMTHLDVRGAQINRLRGIDQSAPCTRGANPVVSGAYMTAACFLLGAGMQVRAVLCGRLLCTGG